MPLNNGTWEAEDYPTVIAQAMNALKDYLLAGTEDIPGLSTEPLFVTKEGTGAEGDEQTTGTAEVLFINDDFSGKNYVRLVQAGGDFIQPSKGGNAILPVRFVLDCGATKPMQGLNAGVDARSADNILQGHVLRLLSTYKGYLALDALGFHFAKARPEPEIRRQGFFRNPVLLTAELWVEEP